MAPKKKPVPKKAAAKKPSVTKAAAGKTRGKRNAKKSASSSNGDEIDEALQAWEMRDDDREEQEEEYEPKTKAKTRKAAKRKPSATRKASATRKVSLTRRKSVERRRSETRSRTPSRTRSDETHSRSSSEKRPTARRARSVKSVVAIKKQAAKVAARAKKRRSKIEGLEASMRRVNPQNVKSARRLPIEVLDRFSDMLDLLAPSMLYWEATYPKVGEEDADGEEDGDAEKYKVRLHSPKETVVQIHYLENHYLVSYQFRGTVYLYDSLNRSSHVSKVMPQLKLIYQSIATSGIPEQYIRYFVPQEQGSTNDCGLFAAAWALMLEYRDSDPMFVTLDQERLREHMCEILERGKPELFPLIDSPGKAIESRESFDLTASGDARKPRTPLSWSDTDMDDYSKEVISGAIPSINGFALVDEMFAGRHTLLGWLQIAVLAASFVFLCIYFKEIVLPYFGFATASGDVDIRR